MSHISFPLNIQLACSYCIGSKNEMVYTPDDFNLRLNKSAWSPSIGEVLSLQTDAENEHDAYAVGTIKDSTVVGHNQ